jgi:hypothetical protein
MSALALLAWSVTALAGIYLLAIWLIEYDPDFQHAAATRLPVLVVCGHVLFAVVGLLSWVAYLITDKRIYCWGSTAALILIATLGFTMAFRWIGVYRATSREAISRNARAPAYAGAYAPWPDSPQRWPGSQTPGAPSSGQARPWELAVPPERHFPVSVVIAHGLFAITTVTLVVLTFLGVG